MKSLFFLLGFCALTPPAVTAQSGIQFFKGTWQQALAQADSSGKLVFVDVYADWCKPCKVMEQQTFGDPEVAQFMNAFFVNYRADAESGGRWVTNQYNVKSLPTLLFVRPDGTVTERRSGFLNKDRFLPIAETVFENTSLGQVFQLFENKWQAGPKTPTLASGYFKLRNQFGLDNAELLNDLLKALPPDSLALALTEKLVVGNVRELEGAAFDYLCGRPSSRRCAFKINFLLDKHNTAAIAERSEKKLKKVLEAAERGLSSEPEKLVLKKARIQAAFYLETGKIVEFAAFNRDFVPQHLLPRIKDSDQNQASEHSILLDNIGWQYARFVDDREALQEALTWLQQANEAAPSAMRMSHAARIAMKTGQKSAAVEWLQKAIALGKTHSEDVGAWEQLLADYSAN